MIRFNGHDHRMDRSLDCAAMLMEAFKNRSSKIEYQIFGHSGDGPEIQMFESKPPVNEAEMYKVLTKMQSHAKYCMSGDNTLNAIISSIKNITKKEADEYFVLVLSDANLHQYNIDPKDISHGMYHLI